MKALLIGVVLSSSNAIAQDIVSEFRERYYPEMVADVFYSNEFSEPMKLKKRRIENRMDVGGYGVSVIRWDDRLTGRLFYNTSQPLDSILINETLKGIHGDSESIKRNALAGNLWGQVCNLSAGAPSEIEKMGERARLLAVRDYSHIFFRLKALVNFEPSLKSAVSSAMSQQEVDYYPRAMENMRLASDVGLTSLTEDEMRSNPLRKMADCDVLPETLKMLFSDPESCYEVPVWEKFDHMIEFGGGSHFHIYVAFPGKTKDECKTIVESVLEYRMMEKARTGNGPLSRIVPGMEFVLVRYAAAAGKMGESVRIPVVEEVFYRRFGMYDDFAAAEVRPDSSDYFGGEYKLYQLDRKRFLAGERFYLTEIKNDDPVFYGFSTGAPHGRNRHVVTMRGNCMDCHASLAPTWGSVGFVRNWRDYQRKRHPGEIEFVKKDAFVAEIKYLDASRK